MNKTEAVSGNSETASSFLISYKPDIMKIKKPDWKDIVIFIESAILFKLLFQFWDEVKASIAGIFT